MERGQAGMRIARLPRESFNKVCSFGTVSASGASARGTRDTIMERFGRWNDVSHLGN